MYAFRFHEKLTFFVRIFYVKDCSPGGDFSKRNGFSHSSIIRGLMITEEKAVFKDIINVCGGILIYLLY